MRLEAAYATESLTRLASDAMTHRPLGAKKKRPLGARKRQPSDSQKRAASPMECFLDRVYLSIAPAAPDRRG